MAKTMTKGASDLPKFRYLDDVTRYVDEMAHEVDLLTKVSKKQAQMLASLKSPAAKVQALLTKAASFVFTVGPDDDDDKDQRRNLKRKIDPNLVKVVVPNLKKLQERYALAEEFYEKRRSLESVEATLTMQFRNRSEGPAYNEALSSVRALRAKVDAALKEVLGELHEIASGHIPKTFQTYMHAVEEEVQRHVNFEDSNLFLYVHVSDDGEIVFTYYLLLNHAINDEGKVTPHLYIAVQWIVGDKGGHVKVYVNHEYELPNKLMREPGTAVSNAGEAVKAISHLLDLEDFSTALGTLPFKHHLAKDPNPDLFSYKEFVSKVAVDNENMIFKLRRGVGPSQRREIAYQLYQEVKHMLKVPKGAKLKMEISSDQILFNLASVASPGQVNTYQAEWIKDQFGLSDSALRKVVNIINQDKG